MARVVNRRGVVDKEDTRLVAVERERLAILFDVRSGRFKVAQRRLEARKVHDHQLVGRIVDINKRRASWRSISNQR